MKFISGHLNVSLHRNRFPTKINNKIISLAIARVALDQKLGCLEDEHAVDSDTQNLIDAINVFFANVPELELKIPFWKLFSTPTWRKYINALDTITK